MTNEDFHRKWVEINAQIDLLVNQRKKLCREYCKDNPYIQMVGKKVVLITTNGDPTNFEPFFLESISMDYDGKRIAVGRKVDCEKIIYYRLEGYELKEV